MSQRIKAWIRLLQAKEIGSVKGYKLIKALGDPVRYVGCDSDFLNDIALISDSTKAQLRAKTDPENWEVIERLMERCKIKYCTILDDDYPELLKNIYSPPLVLFYRGQLSKSDNGKESSFAVVGTRKADSYGLLMTKKITEILSLSGFTIVSGLAYGIDTKAHQTVVENNGRTIAVLGSGCETIYPQRNESLAQKIIENGALVSEFIPGTKIEKWFFPQRNRIISGLSQGVLMIQGKKSSGAVLTAKFAIEQNRDLFALPGDVNRYQSEGPNYLIRLGAKPIANGEDILEDYDMKLVENSKTYKLKEKEGLLLDLIKENKPSVNYDFLVMNTGYSIGELSSIILSLELKGLVEVGNNNIVFSKE